MARIKLAYIGGASTRAPGTMASLVERGADFSGSEVVLVDLHEDRLALVRELAERMAKAKGLDLRVSATADRRAALQDCDAVLTSYRPGGFEARALDERIPLKYGVIGQETQGPGGFFMALRTIHVMRQIVEDVERICPRAWLVNYTNPINLVGEGITHHSDVNTVSLCDGPIAYPRMLARAAGLDPDRVAATMVGINHLSWSVTHAYGDRDLMAEVRAAHDRWRAEGAVRREGSRLLELAATMGAIASSYFVYYYFEDEVLQELREKATTRAEDIIASTRMYWDHYREQADRDAPVLDPERSRGGIHELELAIDVMSALFNGRDETWPVNVTNAGRAVVDLPEDRVVEAPGRVHDGRIDPIPQPPLARHVVGLVEMLAEHQALAARAAWSGTRADAIRALAAHPWCTSLRVVERMYDELAAAHRAYLPERLLS